MTAYDVIISKVTATSSKFGIIYIHQEKLVESLSRKKVHPLSLGRIAPIVLSIVPNHLFQGRQICVKTYEET